MPATPATPRVKLRSVSRRVPRSRNAAAEVDESPEPTMRLSRAILVMLLLHVFAVGGFLASSVLKERDLKRTSADPNTAVEADDAPVPARGGNSAAQRPATESTRPGIHVVRPGETLTLIANENGVSLEALVAANGASTVTNGLKTGQELKLPDHSPDPAAVDPATNALNQIEAHPKSSPHSAATPPAPAKIKPNVPDGGRTYTVAKGENLYNIAQKNKVSYEQLLKLNQIDDPKKVQPGQKIRLPAPSSTAKPKPKQT